MDRKFNAKKIEHDYNGSQGVSYDKKQFKSRLYQGTYSSILVLTHLTAQDTDINQDSDPINRL